MTIFVEHCIPAPCTRTVQALLVHETREELGSAVGYLFTSHRVEQTPTGPLIAEGRLWGSTDQKALIDALLGSLSGSESAYLPPEIIAYSAAQLAWYVPARIAPMWFRLDPKAVRFRVPWPAMLLRVNSGRLAIAALKADRRPRAETPLFHAPLMNVFENTLLCAGSTVLPATCTLADRSAFEAALFETNFSHVNHERTMRVRSRTAVSTETHLRFWRQLHTTRATRFPTSALVPLNCTVGTWLLQQQAGTS